MQASSQPIPLGPLVSVHSESPGQVTARVVGLPEVQATAATRAEALERLREVVAHALASGRLAILDLPRENGLMKWFGHAREEWFGHFHAGAPARAFVSGGRTELAIVELAAERAFFRLANCLD